MLHRHGALTQGARRCVHLLRPHRIALRLVSSVSAELVAAMIVPPSTVVSGSFVIDVDAELMSFHACWICRVQRVQSGTQEGDSGLGAKWLRNIHHGAESVENKKTRRQASMPSLGAIVFLPTCGAQDVAEFVVVLGSQ